MINASTGELGSVRPSSHRLIGPHPLGRMSDANPPSAPRGRFRSLDDPETLRFMAHRIGEGVYIADADGAILDANAAFLTIMGLAGRDELASFHPRERCVDPSRCAERTAQLDACGEVREFEWAIQLADGERRTLLDTAFTHADPETGERLVHGVVVDITDRKRLEDQLRDQLIRDALTGCYNRRFLLDVAARRSPGAAEEQWGCIFVDIDHFKAYNDTHGHANGDAVLVAMARFLMREVRANEPVIRMGGDEFLILLLGADMRATADVAQRLQHAAARKAPAPFSLGHASRENGEGLTATIDRADQELLQVRVLRRTGEPRRLPEEMERRRP